MPSRPPASGGRSAPKPKASPRPKAAPRGRSSPPRRSWRATLLAALATIVVGVGLGLGGAAALLLGEARVAVRAQLAEPPPAAPLRVWSGEILVADGSIYPLAELVEDLVAAGYERGAGADAARRFTVDGDVVRIVLEGESVTVRFDDDGRRIVRVAPGGRRKLGPTLLAVLGDRDRQRTPVQLDALSPHVAPALLSIEDARFRDHVGVDPIGLTRALVVSLRGGPVQGGSTLTQQLAKNRFVGPERSVRRKVREAFVAAALEAELTKDELLALYLSDVYLGHVDGTPIHGVEQAARAWFGKSAASLTLAEAATIVGVIASPNQWSPVVDATAALGRRDVVLGRMVAVHALTEDQAAAARAEPLTVLPRAPGTSWRLPWVVDAALAAANLDAATGGEVRTTVRPHAQRLAQAALTDGLAALAQAHPEAASAEGAVVVLHESGDVLALVGGRSFAQSPFPRATRAERQAGSAIKPLTLLLALDADPALTATTVIDDSPLTRTVDGTTWSPGNADGRFLGPIPLREAIARSRNAPAVLLAEKVGRGTLRDRLEAAGLADATALPSAALGAFPVTPLALAGAWTAFPGDGVARLPRLVRVVETAGGAADSRTAPRVRLASADAAAEAVDILRSVLVDGTGKRAAELGVTGAFGGKTGTTDEGRDAWFVGFDPDHVVVVWVGLDRGTLGLSGAEAALPIWARVVTDLGLGGGSFPAPTRTREAPAISPPPADPAPEPAPR